MSDAKFIELVTAAHEYLTQRQEHHLRDLAGSRASKSHSGGTPAGSRAARIVRRRVRARFPWRIPQR